VVGVGRVDPVVPPETVYAVVNHLPTAPQVWELPVSHSDAPEEAEWTGFDRRWLEPAVG
jgi:cephalosporin-C deacetylase-like acetyl esterase